MAEFALNMSRTHSSACIGVKSSPFVCLFAYVYILRTLKTTLHLVCL